MGADRFYLGTSPLGAKQHSYIGGVWFCLRCSANDRSDESAYGGI
jgi:hypothetical protein